MRLNQACVYYVLILPPALSAINICRMFWTFFFSYLSHGSAPGCDELKQPPGGIWAGRREESLPAHHFCLAGSQMIAAKHCLQSLTLMRFVLVCRVSLLGCGSDQAVIFQCDWPSFSQQFASAINTSLCNPRNFREVWGKVYEPNQSEAVLCWQCQNMTHVAGLIPWYVQIPFHGDKHKPTFNLWQTVAQSNLLWKDPK